MDPGLRFEVAGHAAVCHGYVRGAERQLALRLNRSNEANELLELGRILSPCLVLWSR